MYKILCAIKITLQGWSQTACSKLALVLLQKASHRLSSQICSGTSVRSLIEERCHLGPSHVDL